MGFFNILVEYHRPGGGTHIAYTSGVMMQLVIYTIIYKKLMQTNIRLGQSHSNVNMKYVIKGKNNDPNWRLPDTAYNNSYTINVFQIISFLHFMSKNISSYINFV